MAQELIFKRIAIVGAGPAGCACALFLQKSGVNNIAIFESKDFLKTLLPTGGGRCNLAHSEFDFKELAKNYPRGEKFLYSVFSRFGVKETLDFFDSIGVKTYTQPNGRIFPVSNSSKDVRQKFLKTLKCELVKEKVLKIEKLDSGYKIETEKSKYFFDVVVISIGGHGGLDLVKNLGVNTISQSQSLSALKTSKDFSILSGVSLKNVSFKIGKEIITDDLLFTHKGISGPLIYKISSIFARKTMPYNISLSFVKDFDFQNYLDKNSKKNIKNLLGEFIPKSLAEFLLNDLEVDETALCHQINGKMRDLIYKNLVSYEIEIVGKIPDSEVVISGGVDLKEINPKTMECKKLPQLYFCGEILDIDGFCGGFNLQNCWSTAFVSADAIANL